MNLQPDPQSDVASRKWVFAFGMYLILLNLLLLYLLLRLWPDQVGSSFKTEAHSFTLIPHLWVVSLWPEIQFLALVAVAGGLGSYIHLATSFADYLGNRQFVKSWMWWYALRPFIGSALAVIVYFAARGGLIAGTSGAGDLSPYGVAGLAGLAGMFSKQATDKLREVFENLFRTEKPPRADPLKSGATDPVKASS
ncbi:MAG: hypothetical protein ACRD2P_04105 [Terriglobia bacterium]